jgi:hypothetical protein
MSQVEVHVGQLMKIDKLESTTPEEWCKEYFLENGITQLDHYYESWVEYFNDEYYEEFLVHKNDIYRKIKDTECYGGDDIYHAHKNENGTIDYILSYYNGGCGFTEAIEEALNNLN